MNQSETRIACGADISKIQDNLSDIRSGNLEKLSDRKKNLSDRIKTLNATTYSASPLKTHLFA
jgi:hypothetical protein